MSTHDRDKLGHIQQEIGRLRADNARLHARADALAEAQRNPAAQLTNAQPAGVPSPETAEAVLAREAEAISEQASREPVDAGWAGEAEARLADAFQDLAAVDSSLRLVDVECRSSLCRIDLTAESDVNTTTILARLPWDGARFFRLNREVDGSVTIAGYVAREGFALPSSQARSGGQDPVSR